MALVNRQPMTLVEGVLRGVWDGDGLVWGGGRWWEWNGERWEEIGEQRVGRRALEWLVGATVRTKVGEEWGEKPVNPRAEDVREVVSLMKWVRGVEWERVPRWVEREEERPAFGVRGGKVVVVGVDGVEVVDGGKRWFDPAVLQAEWVEGAECPTWERCVGEWGEGDPKWGDLLARVMGYALVGWRGFQRWVLMEGVARGGKSTVCGVLKGLLGRSGYRGVGMASLAGQFGLDGMQWARVMVVNECYEMKTAEGRAVAARIKEAVGQDETRVDVKYERGGRGEVLGGLPVVVANEMPVMANKGDGMVSKMLVLPFRVSFVGREDLGLEAKLKAEYAGIVQWAVRGLRRALRAQGAERWPVPEAAGGMAGEFRARSSTVSGFVHERFVESAGGFVSTEAIHREWKEFNRAHGLREGASTYALLERMREECSWPIRKMRSGGGKRGLGGLLLRSREE